MNGTENILLAIYRNLTNPDGNRHCFPAKFMGKDALTGQTIYQGNLCWFWGPGMLFANETIGALCVSGSESEAHFTDRVALGSEVDKMVEWVKAGRRFRVYGAGGQATHYRPSALGAFCESNKCWRGMTEAQFRARVRKATFAECTI